MRKSIVLSTVAPPVGGATVSHGMTRTRFRFPGNFHWGSATAAHQVEGGTRNDWSLWERSRERQTYLRKRGKKLADFVSGDACDFWNRYESDLDVAQKLGHTMFRMSLEWSRIESQEGIFDEKALAHYVKIIDAVRERGMEPMVTLWHFTNPLWFSERGGFRSRQAPEQFARYAGYVVRTLRDRVRYWVTFNEATTVYGVFAYLRGVFPPQERNLFHFEDHRKGVVKAHNLAYTVMKQVCDSHCQVGSVENNRVPVTGALGERLRVREAYNRSVNHWFWHRTAEKNDFLGINYYNPVRLPGSENRLSRLPHAPEMDWEIWPKGIYDALRALEFFKKPVFVTENGIADATDALRADFIREHIQWVAQAMKEGSDVRGYLYWSLLDNFEWTHGYRPRFGLVNVDYETQRRTIRKSAFEYAKIIGNHAVDLPDGGRQLGRGRRDGD